MKTCVSLHLSELSPLIPEQSLIIPCSRVPQSTPLDKERQVFRRRRHQDVKATAARSTQSTFPCSPATGPSLSPADFTSESEDISPSSAETVRSPTSPF